MIRTLREQSRILLVDDEPEVLRAEKNLLELEGFTGIVLAEDAQSARAAFDSGPVALVLLDLTLRREHGRTLLVWIREKHPETEVVIITASSDVSEAVECMRLGAYDYLVKGSDTGRLAAAARNALNHQQTRRENALLRHALLRGRPENARAFSEFITASPIMERMFVYLEAVAQTPDPILVTGETGVGKELIARAIHASSERSGPFVVVNLGGLDEHTFSDTLFGHTRGAFTGATEAREGLVKKAAGGTLFLDEFAEISPESQVKLLRLIDTGDYLQLGSDRAQRSQARLIFATNRVLQQEMESRRFRQDLFYRISAHWVEIPPLRERPEDIAPLVNHFMLSESARLGIGALPIDESTIQELMGRSWRGNARELRQVVAKMLVRGSWSTALPYDQEPQSEAGQVVQDRKVAFGAELPAPDEVIDALLQEADRRHPGDRAAAAASIGLSPQAFANRWRRMEDRASRSRSSFLTAPARSADRRR